ncbi:MAG: chromosome partitioning protein ParB [Firmicutes bacterium HGW-Firmicutes-2]|jgi:ParB family chromosome partitioning protein|nr:MAG: chromosome partitioning protein ParB [Firmicutes bacterium HGW-Firmicutes-2]
MENQIQMIPIEKLNSHPLNPRKQSYINQPELKELEESIKENGVMQNLTVVPWYSQITGVGADEPEQQERMGYLVVIGNRRLAAAKNAGLKELPCMITTMDKKTQVAIMLMENMQRADLTLIEQAEGFQMMMDLGETFSSISTMTGLSESTVRRRAKLLELDKEALTESVERGGSITDYVELDKVKDPELKNKVLKTIGTNNFNNELLRAIQKEESMAKDARIVEVLSQYGTQVESREDAKEQGYGYATWVTSEERIQEELEKGRIDHGLLFSKAAWNFEIYMPVIEEEEVEVDNYKVEQAKRDKQNLLIEEAKEISNRHRKLRKDFVLNISNTKAKKHLKEIIEMVFLEMDWYGNSDPWDIAEQMGHQNLDDDEWTMDKVKEVLKDQHEKGLLLMAYEYHNDSSHMQWNGNYMVNEKLIEVYNFLERLGYKKSLEETQMEDGTHEIYAKIKEARE